MPKNKILVWGILLKLLDEARPTSAAKVFTVNIARGSPANPLFFSSPALQKLLVQFPDLVNKKEPIGHIGYYWNSKKNAFEVSAFPFNDLDAPALKAFKKKGIGEALSRKTYRKLQNIVGVVRLIPFQSVSDTMLKKLGVLGIKVTERESPINRYYESTTMDLISRINMIRRRRRRLSQEHRRNLNRKSK